MRFAYTDEEMRLSDMVAPYQKIYFNPLRGGIDENAPDEIKQAYDKLMKLLEEHAEACREY